MITTESPLWREYNLYRHEYPYSPASFALASSFHKRERTKAVRGYEWDTSNDGNEWTTTLPNGVEVQVTLSPDDFDWNEDIYNPTYQETYDYYRSSGASKSIAREEALKAMERNNSMLSDDNTASYLLHLSAEYMGVSLHDEYLGGVVVDGTSSYNQDVLYLEETMDEMVGNIPSPSKLALALL